MRPRSNIRKSDQVYVITGKDRGKTGRVIGHLMASMTTMKGLPLTYNRDLQEDKEGLFDAADTILSALEVAAGMVSTAEYRPQKMREAAEASYVLATDVADYLVGKGMCGVKQREL